MTDLGALKSTDHSGMIGMSRTEPSAMRPYRSLSLWFPVHVAFMYVLMFTMIDFIGNFWNNSNMFYMAVLMAAPMAALMVLTMPHMFTDRVKTGGTVGAVTLIAVLAFAGIRGQWAVGDHRFLRAMVPHHAGAILMCHEATLTDPRIVTLCREIEAGQASEIDLMTRILSEQGAPGFCAATGR